MTKKGVLTTTRNVGESAWVSHHGEVLEIQVAKRNGNQVSLRFIGPVSFNVHRDREYVGVRSEGKADPSDVVSPWSPSPSS